MIIINGRLFAKGNAGRISIYGKEHIFELAQEEKEPFGGNAKIVLNDSLVQIEVQAYQKGQPIRTLLNDWIAPHSVDPLKKFILNNSRVSGD